MNRAGHVLNMYMVLNSPVKYALYEIDSSE